jgi:hypothetical protein
MSNRGIGEEWRREEWRREEWSRVGIYLIELLVE